MSTNLKADTRTPIMTTVTKTHRHSASVCQPSFPCKSWKRACIPLPLVYPVREMRKNASRMQERTGHNKYCVMLGPRTPCPDVAGVCGRGWACLQGLKRFKTLKPAINSEHMELLHLGSDSTNACG